jgi:hypothetical protein
MIGTLIVVAIAALVASPPQRADRELGEMLARRIACAPRYPVPCGRNPLALAYGFPLGKLVRSLAPTPGADAGELPVDFRYCRQASCAAPGSDPGLTSSRRRVTEFTSIEDARRSGGRVRVTYWLYRPGLGWERIVRTGGAAEIAAASRIRLNLEDDPALVPLETLPAATTTTSRGATSRPGAGRYRDAGERGGCRQDSLPAPDRWLERSGRAGDGRSGGPGRPGHRIRREPDARA